MILPRMFTTNVFTQIIIAIFYIIIITITMCVRKTCTLCGIMSTLSDIKLNFCENENLKYITHIS